jgi:hypothetical protein
MSTSSLLKPTNEDVLISRPVSKAVGNVKNNAPELLDESARAPDDVRLPFWRVGLTMSFDKANSPND